MSNADRAVRYTRRMGAQPGIERRDGLEAMPAGWAARLELQFAREGTRSVLVSRRHSGPLVVQKVLYPEGQDVCQVIVVHPPGGIVGGDSLTIDVDAGSGSQVQV